MDTADIKVYINKYSEVKQSSREAHGHESLLLQCFLSHALTSRSVMELNSGISLVTTNPNQNVRTRALLATIQDAAATDGSR